MNKQATQHSLVPLQPHPWAAEHEQADSQAALVELLTALECRLYWLHEDGAHPDRCALPVA